jgi:hypothetical protein
MLCYVPIPQDVLPAENQFAGLDESSMAEPDLPDITCDDEANEEIIELILVINISRSTQIKLCNSLVSKYVSEAK